ncbi:MAG TPA: rRNA maturation RNase YbeY [Dissulfurispiraceae bacterium]|nr:rRNA maturation RNase YbeY [Dissulfurispiraceae bacterium]
MAAAVRNRQRAVRVLSDAISKCVDTALRAALAKVAPQLPLAGADMPFEVSVMLVNDRVMRALNRNYRAKDKTTDVLSFPQFDDAPALVRAARGASGSEQILLGDVVISIAQALRQSTERKVPLSEELARLLIHGVLHLVGYDHERSNADARVMQSLENAILRRVGKEPLCSN